MSYEVRGKRASRACSFNIQWVCSTDIYRVSYNAANPLQIASGEVSANSYFPANLSLAVSIRAPACRLIGKCKIKPSGRGGCRECHFFFLPVASYLYLFPACNPARGLHPLIVAAAFLFSPQFGVARWKRKRKKDRGRTASGSLRWPSREIENLISYKFWERERERGGGGEGALFHLPGCPPLSS